MAAGLIERVGFYDEIGIDNEIDAEPSATFATDCYHDRDSDGGPVHPDVLDDAAIVAHLLSHEPGPFAMSMLAGIDPASLDADSRLSYLEVWARQQAWVAAAHQQALADVFLADLPEDDHAIGEELKVRAEMIATALHWSPSRAMGRLMSAVHIACELPGTFALLQAGELSWRHVEVMAEVTAGLDEAAIGAVESRVLQQATEQTPAEFGRSVRRAVLVVAPAEAAAQHDMAVRSRHVRRCPGRDGMALFTASLTAADAEMVYLGLDAVARKAAAVDPDDSLGIDARRADALVSWALAALADPTLPKHHGRPVALRVTIDLASLLGLAEHPAQLGHYGLIPASVARTLAADASWQRLVTEPVTGHLLDVGRTVYRPPQALQDFLLARDRICRFPGCAMAAERCDIDHGHPFHEGGHTSACNCHCLCRRHHNAKTKGDWLLTGRGDGNVTFTSPTGRQYFVPAEDHDPAH